jgi:hypothetical protein
MWIRLASLAAVMMLALTAGCGGDDVPAERTEPFVRAIETYLAENSMGMKIDRFTSLDVTGDAASARVRMADKDIGYGMTPVWTFSFERDGDAWRVARVER